MTYKSEYRRNEAYCRERAERTHVAWVKTSFLAAADRWRGLADPVEAATLDDVAYLPTRAPAVTERILQCPPPFAAPS